MKHMHNSNFAGDAQYVITPMGGDKVFHHRERELTYYTKKSMHKLAQQIFNNKSLRAKNRMRKVARQFAVVTIR